jgi:DNA-binding response OmpR family regulator
MNFPSSVDSSSVARAHASGRSFSSSRGRILLIEDDREIAEEVTNELLDRAYDVSQVATGSEGTEEARRGGYDLLIVDLLLPGCDGISIIRELRRDHIQVPVLVVSALGAITDRVRALKTGCDDYVTKPFAHMLLEDVWHYRFLPQTNLVDVHIGRLRRKIDGPEEAPVLLSVRGMGFILRESH